MQVILVSSVFEAMLLEMTAKACTGIRLKVVSGGCSY
jgi:hypothetical protein